MSTKPFGTPLGPYLLKWGMTFIMIVAPPAGDAFQFGKRLLTQIRTALLTITSSCQPEDVP